MRKVGIVVGAIILVLILAVVVFAARFNVNQYRGTFQSELEKRLDRRVVLGDVHLGISATLASTELEWLLTARAD